MHVNWRMPLGGVLSGILPNPDFSAQAYIQSMVFGSKQIATLSSMTGTLPLSSIPSDIYAFAAAQG